MPARALHDWLSFDAEASLDAVTRFLSESFADAGADRAVVGVSGGVDSATTLAAAAEALGPESVDAIFMPGPTSPEEDQEAASSAARAASVDLDRVTIGPMLDEVEAELGVDVDRDTHANLQARLRMCVLYARANAREGLVLGTGNKSELLTGYFTKHGDGAADLLPLGEAYKTQVRVLAARLGVPERVIERPPTAGLWEGQRDEDELGLPYDQLDVVLAGLAREVDRERIARAADVDVAEVDRVAAMVDESEHKRTLPPTAELPVP